MEFEFELNLFSVSISKINNYYFNLRKEKIYNFKIKVDKWGSALAFFSWLPVLGDPIAVSLGFFRINYILVATWMLFGKIFRYIIWSLFTVWGISLI